MSAAPASKLPCTVVLVGLMGAGKSCIGRRLASQLALDFVDADAEIERAAGCSIEEIFERHGESAFRDGERRVIARLLNRPIHVLATGGGFKPGCAVQIRQTTPHIHFVLSAERQAKLVELTQNILDRMTG